MLIWSCFKPYETSNGSLKLSYSYISDFLYFVRLKLKNFRFSSEFFIKFKLSMSLSMKLPSLTRFTSSENVSVTRPANEMSVMLH